MSARSELARLQSEIPENVKIVAVTKTIPVEVIREVYEAGHRLFGENKAQEMTTKQPLLPPDCQWHFIGHLQTNKVKFIAPFVSVIQSVDSLKLLKEINKEALKNGRIIDCLLQFYIATEESKFGLDVAEAADLLSNPEYNELKNIKVKGVMGMASFSDDTSLVRREFRNLKAIHSQLKNDFFRDDPEFCEISMGMTGDFHIAIEEGSTIVRIGTAIFGKR